MAQAQILYAGTESGVAILTNPGRSTRWLLTGIELAERRISALECNPDQPLEVLAASGDALLHSADGGQSWEETTLMSAPQEPSGAVTLAGAPPAMLRCGTAGIERSEDGGTSWHLAAAPLSASASVLLAAPYHPDTAFAGTTAGELWISTDRGRSWQLLKHDLPPITALAAGRVL